MSAAGRVAMVAFTRYSSDSRVRRHVAALVGAGYAVDVFTLQEAPDALAGAATADVRFCLIPPERVHRGSAAATALDQAHFLLRCAALLLARHRRHGPYDLVHVNNMPDALVLAALPLRRLGTPVLLDVHDTMPELAADRFDGRRARWLAGVLRVEERLSMHAADFVLTSEHTKSERLCANGLDARRSAVVLNLPDPSLFPDVLPAPTDPRTSGFRLVYHGTLAHRLGIDVAVEAVHLLRDRLPGLRFDVIGDGEQRPALVERIDELDLGGHVVLSDGFVPVERLAPLLRGADLAVLPSRRCASTELMLPTKLLEYVQLGIPAVTVPTATIRRYFDEEQLAFVPGDDPVALATRIHQLWQDPLGRRRQACAARRFLTLHPAAGERDRYLDVVAAMTAARTPAGA